MCKMSVVFLMAVTLAANGAVAFAMDDRDYVQGKLNALSETMVNVAVCYSLIEEYGYFSESGAVIANNIQGEARAMGREVPEDFVEALSKREEHIDGHVFVFAGKVILNQFGTYSEVQRIAGGIERLYADLEGRGLKLLHHIAMKSTPSARHVLINDGLTRVIFELEDRPLKENRARVFNNGGASATWSRDPAYMYVTRLQNALRRAASVKLVEEDGAVQIRMAYENGSSVVLDCNTNGPFQVMASRSLDEANHLLSETTFEQFNMGTNACFPYKIVEVKYNNFTNELKLRSIIQVDSMVWNQDLSRFTFDASTNGISRIRDMRPFKGSKRWPSN